MTIENSVLSPRQKIASVPYAIHAGSVAEVKTNSTLIGRGTSAAPLGIDAVHYGFTFEADACNTATAGTSVVVNDPTASSGKACEAVYGAAAGRMFGIHASNLGRLVAAQPSQVDFRLKVGANTSAATVLTINCAAIRAGSDSWVSVGKPLPLAPNDFASPGAWQTFSLGCDWRPDDVDQFLGVDGFVPKITDAYVDFIQVRPSRQPMAGLLLDSGGFDFTLANGITNGTITFNVPFTQPPAVTCSEAGSPGGWVVCKFDSVTKTGAAYAIQAFNSGANYSGHLSWIAVGR